MSVINYTSEDVLRWLKKQPGKRATAREVCNALGRDVGYARDRLGNLVRDQKVGRPRGQRADRPLVYMVLEK